MSQQDYAREWMGAGWDKPDTGKVSGLTVKVSRETRRARRRSEYGGRVNTNANRRNGGGAVISKPKPEELAGRARMIPPTTAGLRNSDDFGIPYKRQHMLTVQDEDTILRNRERERANRRIVNETK